MIQPPKPDLALLEVTPAGPADVPGLAAVAARTFPLACPPGTTAEDVALFLAQTLSASRFQAYLTDPARRVLVLRRTSVSSPATPEIVGYTMTIRGAVADPEAAAVLPSGPQVELSKCYVDAGVHGTGAAALLLDATCADARAQGHPHIWLGVNQRNERAQRFYAKNGFERRGVKHFLVGRVRHADYVMMRPLT